MRKPHTIPLLLLILALGLLTRKLWTLITLLFEDGVGDAITPLELERGASIWNESSGKEGRGGQWTGMIPKVMHQTYANDSVPERWREAQRSCREMAEREGWVYMFWNDTTALSFLATHYPSSLPPHLAYPTAIQRSDSLRYHILHHHGGLYLDLDEACTHPLTPLLPFPAWLRKTRPTGISNDVMASTPGHPFFGEVVRRLQVGGGWGWGGGGGYVGVMYSTGPGFLSVVWKEWMAVRARGEEGGRVRVLMEGESAGFFEHVSGRSCWHGGDAVWILWAGRHWVGVTLFGTVIGFLVLWGVWRGYLGVLGLVVGAEGRYGFEEGMGEKRWVRQVGVALNGNREKWRWESPRRKGGEHDV